MDLDRRKSNRREAPTSGSVEDELAKAEAHVRACEAALEESEARFRSIIERNADAIVVVDQNGLVRYANAMAGRTFGIDPRRLVASPFGFPLTVGETTVIDVLVGGEPRVAEMRVFDSTWDGAPMCLASIRDITDLETLRRERAARLAAKLAESRMREIFSQAPVAIAVLRGPEHRFDLTNPRYDELIGKRHVAGKPIREALPEIAGQRIVHLMDDVYATGVPYVGTEVPVTIDREAGGAEELFFTFVYHPLRDGDGGISGIAVVATDVTSLIRARKAAEEANGREQRARAEAERANKAKSDFLATMSHELRTPLNAIGGYADLILAGIRGPITEPQRIDLERINRSQRHLLSVINDILNFAKLEAGQLQLDLQDVSMNEALGDLESLVSPILLQKKIEYEYRCCDPKYQAHADRERLQQVLLNLLSNAAKFTPSGGRIIVECIATQESMMVRVSDTGVGIPSDRMQQIFEPFVQLERGQAPEMGGTGLGLAISRDLARLMGGDLTAESKVGEGSTFVLTLKRARNGLRMTTL
jgi:signal transduction histidine kinase